MRVDIANASTIIFFNLLLGALQLIIDIMHGDNNALISFAFFVAYIYPITKLAMCKYKSKIHMM